MCIFSLFCLPKIFSCKFWCWCHHWHCGHRGLVCLSQCTVCKSVTIVDKKLLNLIAENDKYWQPVSIGCHSKFKCFDMQLIWMSSTIKYVINIILIDLLILYVRKPTALSGISTPVKQVFQSWTLCMLVFINKMSISGGYFPQIPWWW